MKYRGIFEYEYPTEHKTPVSIDVHLHGDCVKGKIIEWEYRPLEQNPTTKNDLGVDCISRQAVIDMTGLSEWFDSSDSYNEFVFALNELPSVTSQEPMVEIDLYSVIKQKYIEREVLDKIRAEIEQLRLHKAQFLTNDNKVCIDSQEVLNILDKYKAESEK